MSSVWNLLNPIRNGGTNLKLLSGGREFFGTVIKHGKMDKTVTVKVNYQYYVQKYNGYVSRSSKFLCHDEENFTISGDKVVIKSCQPLSTRKHYFVRNIVKPFARDDFYKQEKNAMFEEEYQKLYKQFLQKQIDNTWIKNKKQEAKIKASSKARAMQTAIQKFRKIEAQQNAEKKQKLVEQKQKETEEEVKQEQNI
ncbi:Nucleic acid-binding, OB-fold [Pseudocohnilembus persalinus]|uniref:Nucleic acid-binding, OB-fold n=1 Tax=Pseudocohnilembus persalinus TaxID=266149 RepID=A0A0V0R4S3_PSEPJ|nr:Nucleic acid-binding, OB-fold [Pseudocohnilembus persalinus]|eukprot:KRX09487.1 Nucleic acid-binding, OB-fold [Pseudocohnilembus persalinus]